MASQKVDLYIDQNSDFYQNVLITDQNLNAVNVTGYSFFGQIREIPSGTVLADFSVSTTSPLTGSLLLEIPASVTKNIPVTSEFNFYRYDIFMKDGGSSILMLFYGDIFVNESITQIT